MHVFVCPIFVDFLGCVKDGWGTTALTIDRRRPFPFSFVSIVHSSSIVLVSHGHFPRLSHPSLFSFYFPLI